METLKKNPGLLKQNIVVKCDIDTVWQVLSDIDRWSSWGGAVNSKLHGPLQVGATFDWQTNVLLHSRIQAIEEGKMISWISKIWGISIIHSITLRKVENATVIYLNEVFEGTMAPLIKKSFHFFDEQDMSTWLEFLKIASEKKCK